MQSKTDVCYVISHGFSSRMVFQTGLLARLVQEGKKVAVISPDGQDPNIRQYCEEAGIDLYEYKVKTDIAKVDYFFKRKYYLEDIRNNPGLWAKHLHATKGNKSLNPYFRLRPYYYYQIYRLIQQYPGIRDRFKRREDRLLDDPGAVKLIKEIDPHLLVATYPVNIPESMLLRAAQKLGKETAIHLLSWDNITCKGAFPATANYYIAWGPIMKEEFMEYYQVKADHIYPCGVPHFDEHVKVLANPDYKGFVKDLGLNPEHPFLFVAMSSPYFAPKGIEVIEWLSERVREGHFGEHMQLIVRPHPQNVQGGMADSSWLPRLEALKNERVSVDYPSLVKSKLPWSMQDHDMRRLSNLLVGCTACINFGSTVTIDALMVNKPVIIAAFDGDERLDWYKSGSRQMDYVHYAKLVALGGCRVANNWDEMSSHLQDFIADPKADWDQRRNALLQECGDNDGRATERVAEALKDILARTSEPATNKV